MPSTSHIGPSITITGDITADEPLTIDGRVEGTVSAGGHPVTIEESGRVKGELRADALIVGGHVNGSLTATTRILIQHSAVVDGSLAAPLLNVVEGAQLNAKVEVTGRRNGSELKIAS